MPVARPESSGARIIAHIDMDCFYVQVEQRKQPHLRGQPTAVVQYNSWKGGGLIAVSYEARKYGVKRSMRGDEAKNVCPQIQLVQVPVAHGKADLSIYRNAGSEVVTILSKKGRCERASIDEVYLDLIDAAEAILSETPPESMEKINEEALKSHVLGINEDERDCQESVREWLQRSDADHRDKLLACGALIVAELRMQVLRETEFTCSAGIAHNKMLAKLASSMNKPAQQTLVPSASVKGLLEYLPIKKMKQLGGKLGTSLQDDLGVNTVGDLLQFSEEKLQERYGINTGTWLWNIARGISGEEVEGRLLPKSHGSAKTFPGVQALKTIASVEHWLNELCEELCERLQSDLNQNKRIAHTLTLHARAFKAGDSESHNKFPSKSCPLRYGAAKMKEDALYLFQAGLRDYLGSCRIKIHGGQHSGWRITSLSVSASKIVPIPSGTCSIMKYFRGQDHSCSYKQINEFVSEAAPISPSGNKSCSGLYTTKTSIEFNKDENSGLAATSLDQLDGNREEFIEESKCESTQSAGHQDSSSMLSKQGKVDFAPETSEVSSKDSHGEKLGIKRLAHGTRSHELKRKKEKDKGTSTILRFFQNCSKYSSSPEEKQGRAVDETKASSSSGFQSMNSCSELNEAKVSEDNIISETGIHSGKLTLGEDEMQNDGWSYKIDEIDHSVIYELPPEIQQEVLAWLQPQKRANIAKRGSTIAQYFFPTKST